MSFARAHIGGLDYLPLLRNFHFKGSLGTFHLGVVTLAEKIPGLSKKRNNDILRGRPDREIREGDDATGI